MTATTLEKLLEGVFPRQPYKTKQFAEFDPYDHPRDEKGRFSSFGSGGLALPKTYVASQADPKDVGWAAVGAPKPSEIVIRQAIGNGEPVDAEPIHRGPGPVLSREEAEEFTKDSALPGAYYRGGGIEGGVFIPVNSVNLSLQGRGVYLISEDADGKTHAGQYGKVNEFRINVQKPLDYYGDEAKAMKASAEYTDLHTWWGNNIGGNWETQNSMVLQIVAQRHGYDALYYKCEGGGRVAIVLDARKAAVVR